jgi:polar amino acid transport system ATP-binding protein
MSQPFISVDKVNKSFGSHHVLRDVCTHFDAGKVTVILGSSGSGKSTLLRMLNRLETHDSGTIRVDGIEVKEDAKSLAALRREVGMVFQQFNLFPHLTVLENVTCAPRRVRDFSLCALRWAAAARGHCTSAGHGAQGHAV